VRSRRELAVGRLLLVVTISSLLDDADIQQLKEICYQLELNGECP